MPVGSDRALPRGSVGPGPSHRVADPAQTHRQKATESLGSGGDGEQPAPCGAPSPPGPVIVGLGPDQELCCSLLQCPPPCPFDSSSPKDKG